MELLSTIVTSALVATIAGAAINEWLQGRRAKQTAKYDALQAAVILEGYGASIARAIINHDLVASTDGHAGGPLRRVPELPKLPKVKVVAEFVRPRKGALMNRILSLPQLVDQAQQYADFWWDVTADPEDASDVLATQTALIGVEAVNLAAALRAEFGLPARELVFGGLDVGTTLAERAASRETDDS